MVQNKADFCASLGREQLLNTVPVSEVNCENLAIIWPLLTEAITNAQLISIDLELSGLGDRSGPSNLLPDRYKRLREAARTRSVLSLGITAFQFTAIDNEQKKNITYKCKVFDILTLEEKPFIVEPEALKFLSSHGFDFNRLFTHGIKYSKKDSKLGPFHALWEEILASGVSVALHNGLTDLAFLHEHFYAPLPEKCDQFVANISDWFGERTSSDDYLAVDCALWDSKYLAEQHQEPQYSFSYLDYVFRKSQRDNQRLFQCDKPHLRIKFSRLPKNVRDVTTCSYLNCGLNDDKEEKLDEVRQENLCDSYTRFGHCRYRASCTKEHDVDFLLDLEEKRAQSKRDKDKRRRDRKKEASNEQMNTNGGINEEQTKKASVANDNIPVEQRNEQKRKCNGVMAGIGVHHQHEKKSKLDNGIQQELEKMPYCSKAVAIRTTSRGGHRAGMDSFMTGFSVLFFQLDYAFHNAGRLDRQLAARISLPGKEFPLLIRKSNFMAQTEGHQLNWARVESRRRAFDRAKYAKWTMNDHEVAAKAP